MAVLIKLFINFLYILVGLILLYFAYYAAALTDITFELFMLVTVIFSVFLTVVLAHMDWYKRLKKKLRFFDLVFVYLVSLTVPFLVFQLNYHIPVKEEYVASNLYKARSVSCCEKHTCYLISYSAPHGRRRSYESAVDSSLCYNTDSILVKERTGFFFIDTYVEEFKLPPSAKKKPREVWYQDPKGWEWTTSTWINH